MSYAQTSTIGRCQTDAHIINLKITGGACASCPLEGKRLKVMNCSCGLKSLCRDCMIDHLREERKPIAFRNRVLGQQRSIAKRTQNRTRIVSKTISELRNLRA